MFANEPLNTFCLLFNKKYRYYYYLPPKPEVLLGSRYFKDFKIFVNTTLLF